MDNGPVITIAFPGSGLPACVTIPGLLVKRDRVPGYRSAGEETSRRNPKEKTGQGSDPLLIFL